MCDQAKQSSIYDILNKTIRQYKVDTDAFGNMSIRVPPEYMTLIPSFIKELTKNHGSIKEWGITNTTLEDVYMKLIDKNQVISETKGNEKQLCLYIIF